MELTITPSTTFADIQAIREAGFRLQMNATKVNSLKACTGLLRVPAANPRKAEIAALRSELLELLELFTARAAQ